MQCLLHKLDLFVILHILKPAIVQVRFTACPRAAPGGGACGRPSLGRWGGHWAAVASSWVLAEGAKGVGCVWGAGPKTARVLWVLACSWDRSVLGWEGTILFYEYRPGEGLPFSEIKLKWLQRSNTNHAYAGSEEHNVEDLLASWGWASRWMCVREEVGPREHGGHKGEFMWDDSANKLLNFVYVYFFLCSFSARLENWIILYDSLTNSISNAVKMGGAASWMWGKTDRASLFR